jgi:hypothetical protein
MMQTFEYNSCHCQADLHIINVYRIQLKKLLSNMIAAILVNEVAGGGTALRETGYDDWCCKWLRYMSNGRIWCK